MNIEHFLVDLLHIEDIAGNRLLDLDGDGAAKTYYLYGQEESRFLFNLTLLAKERYGKAGTLILRRSALGEEQRIGQSVKFVDWECADGTKEPKKLNKYIDNAYKDLKMKGNNPLFLGIGGLRWIASNNQGESKEIVSPILIYPIRLIRSGNNTPVSIEFVGDDVFVNPCLLARLETMWGTELVEKFPHPNGIGVDLVEPVDLLALGNAEEYFARVKAYAEANVSSDFSGNTVFQFEEVVAISQYNHNELCMYYDIRKHRDLIDENRIIDRIFNEREPAQEADISALSPVPMILPRDSAQENMIKRIVAGESLIIKGPPGTGKTQTIANVVAALLDADKKVLLVSQKAAALTEVYGKLPQKLQKFVMLLDSETEEQAANLNPAKVLSELKGLLRERNQFDKSTRVEERYKSIRAELNKAIEYLARYHEDTFGDNKVAGVGYYEAIDRYCKNDLGLVKFVDPLKALRVTREEYAFALEKVERIGDYFDFLTDNGGRSILKCPWYPIDGVCLKDSESALNEYKTLSYDIEVLLQKLQESFNSSASMDEVDLDGYSSWVNTKFSQEELENLFASSANSANLLKEIESYLQGYLEEKDCKNLEDFQINCNDLDEIVRLTKDIVETEMDDDLPVSTWKTFYRNRELLACFINDKHLANCLELVKKLVEQESLEKETHEIFTKVFRENLTSEESDLVLKAYGVFSKYLGQNDASPKFLDFKSKSFINKLKTLLLLNDISFGDLLKGVDAYNGWRSAIEKKEEIYQAFNRVLMRNVEPIEIMVFLAFLQRAQERGGVDAYWRKFVQGLARIEACCGRITRTTGEDYTMGELRSAFKAHCEYQKFLKQGRRFMQLLQLECGANERLEERMSAVVVWSKLAKNAELAELQKWANCIASGGCALQDTIRLANETARSFKSFGSTYFENMYSLKNGKLTFGDLRTFLKQATNRNVVNAVKQYLECLQSEENVLPLEAFFDVFERNPKLRQLATFADYFEHSLFGLAIMGYAVLLGDARNGRGATAENEFERYSEKSFELDEVQVERIEAKCLSRLNPTDPDFAFLEAEKANAGSIRLLLKKNANSMMKLKKCFLLSPYSVSVLFGQEAFFDFDVVIMDEASQLTPTAALPAMFRAKQCVLVGDEYQMPPIKHFRAASERTVVGEDGEEYTIESDLSILSFALKNKAFLSKQLTCHYRSETESLIAFSQKKYYPGMRTFPCPEPKKDGVGIVDIYIPNGAVVNGRNSAEAVKVIECLEEHFSKYYNAETGCLVESVGVVAFGMEQLQEILSSIPNELMKKIKKAEANFAHSMKEKLIFFKTIEKVQGQETEHLILSMTYGKRADGNIYQHFGELNNGKLGQCIFNVAITRAKRSITVIHSLKACEIDSERISFIKEYLEMVENFSDSKRQFVSKSIGKGWLRAVGEFIHSLGVAEDRIVYNYGVTEDSVRIPIAILSRDKERAEAGIWCEAPMGKAREYLDYNVRYFNTLRTRGWKLCRMFAHDWLDNLAAEQERLSVFIKKNVEL